MYTVAFFNPIYRKKPADLNIFNVLFFKGQFKLFQRRLTVHYLVNRSSNYTVKRLPIFLSPAGMSLTKLSQAGNNKIFPAKERLVSDIGFGWGRKSR